MTKMLSEILEEPRVLSQLEGINKEALEDIAVELRGRNIKNVTFAGRGTSDHAAIYGQYITSVAAGAVAGLAVPSTISLYGAELDYTDCLVVAISQSGSAADALEVLRCANKRGAVTVAITNYTDSALAKEAKYHLWCNAGEEKSVAATKTFTAQLGLLYLLTAYWTGNVNMLDDFAKLPEIIDKLCEKAQKDMDVLTARYCYMDDGFVIARGMNYPIALETMLKVQETSYVRLKAYSAADFYHGPMAQIDRGTPVIVYAAAERAFGDNLAMAEKLKALGAEPLVVTDSEAVFEKYPISYLIPEIDDPMLKPIVFATFAQLFAQSLCILRGNDPDSPRNLKKVTVTK